MTNIKRFASKNIHWVLLFPYISLFTLFIVVPVIMAIGLSFTQFDGVMAPSFIGVHNYIMLLARDEVFMKMVLLGQLIQRPN